MKLETCTIWFLIWEITCQSINLVHEKINDSNYCLCLLAENGDNLPIRNDIQIITASIGEFKNLKEAHCNCQLYVISSSSGRIDEIMDPESVNLYIKPHKEVFVFTDGVVNRSRLELTSAMHNLSIYVEIRSEEVKFEKISHPVWDPPSLLLKYNRSFCVSLFHRPPFVYFDEDRGTYDGVDITILREILPNWPLRFSFIKEEEGSGRHLFSEALHEVVNNKCDIAVCFQWLEALHGFSVTKTTQYLETCKTLLIPKAELLPPGTFVFQMFHLQLWLTYLGIFLVSSVMLHSLEIISRQMISSTEKESDFVTTVVDMVRVFSLGSLYKIQYFNYQSLRVFLVGALIFCTLFSTYYSAGLTTALRFPRFFKQIHTLEDAAEMGVKWLDVSEWFKNWMLNTTNENLHKLARFYAPRLNAATDNKFIKEQNSGIAVATTTGNTNYLIFGENLDEYSSNHLKIVDNNIACFYAVFPLRENSPFVDIFSKRLLTLVEGGFVDHWFESYGRKPENRFMKNFFQKHATEFHQVIDLEKLKGAFYFLGFGFVAAAVVFCVEMVLRRIG